MLAHLEDGCTVKKVDLDKYARGSSLWKRYVAREYSEYLLHRDQESLDGDACRTSEGSTSLSANSGNTFDKKVRQDKCFQSNVARPQVYKCPTCDTRFSDLSDLVRHVESIACGESIYGGQGTIGKMLYYIWGCI